MDPLSITASSIAILGAIAGTGKGIDKLISLRKAPLELHGLYNEVEAFRSLLVTVESSLRSIEQSEVYEEHREALCSLLAEAKEATLELERTIEYRLRRGLEVNQNGLPKVSRMTWMRSAGRIEELRLKMRNSRGNLSTALQALNLRISGMNRQTIVQVQSISTVARDSYHVDDQDRVTYETLPNSQNKVTNLVTKCTSVNDIDDSSERSSLETDLQMVKHTSTTESSLIKITTSVTTQQCPRLCPCQCHTRSLARSPAWLKAAVGEILFSYHSFLRTTPCNYPPCRKTPRKTEFSYYFPKWFAQRALIVSSESALSGRGASISIAMPIVIGEEHVIWDAVQHGNIPFIQQLFGRGVNPYVIDTTGRSLVLHAILFSQPEAARFLIQQGANTDWRTRDDISPKILAFQEHNHLSLGNLGWDLEDVPEELDFSALHIAVTMSPALEDLELLLEQRFDLIHARDRARMTPLHWAARSGDAVIVQLLIQWKANVNATDAHQWTPLHEACDSGDLDCVTVLLDAGANVNAENFDGFTPLFFVPARARELVSLLLRRGADIKHRARDGGTVLHYAASWGFSPIDSGHSHIINEFIMHGADLNARDGYGNSPIHRTIRPNQTDAVFALLQASRLHEGSIDLTAITIQGLNILHITALWAGVEIMRLLAHEDLTGVDPTAHTVWGTPNECFVKHRDWLCAIFREPFEIEQKAWHELLQSACLQSNIDFDSLGIAPSATIEEVMTDSDASSDGGDDDGDRHEKETFVDASEVFIAE